MQDGNTLGRGPLPAQRTFGRYRDDLLFRLLGTALGDDLTGRLTLELPSGAAQSFGCSGGPQAELAVGTFGAIATMMTRGAVGFAECYLKGRVTSPDVAEVLRFFIDNRARLETAGRGLFGTRFPERLRHRLRANTRQGSRRNIRAHYDLGNDFYAAWLDDDLGYSSGIYLSPEASLADAQAEKNARLLSGVGVRPGMRILEIGCGWGGLAAAAARHGAAVTAITLSEAQFAYARERMARQGLPVDVRLADYRDIGGTYDAILCVEMIEAVGEENWPTFFRVLNERLVCGGVAMLQAITIREESFAAYRRKPDFIQRTIFPGGMLPTRTILAQRAAAAGFAFETVCTFGESYARTLCDWRRRFEAAWPGIAGLGFTQDFKRLWDYYLIYCQIGFERGVIDVGHYRLTK